MRWEQRNKNAFNKIKASFLKYAGERPEYRTFGGYALSVWDDVMVGSISISCYFNARMTCKLTTCEKNGIIYIGQDLTNNARIITCSAIAAQDDSMYEVIRSSIFDASSGNNWEVAKKIVDEINQARGMYFSTSEFGYGSKLTKYFEDSPTASKLMKDFSSVMDRMTVQITLRSDQFPKCPNKDMMPYMVLNTETNYLTIPSTDYTNNYRSGWSTVDFLDFVDNVDEYMRIVSKLPVKRFTNMRISQH